MNLFPSVRNQSARRRLVEAGSLIIAFAIATLGVAAFVPRAYGGNLASVLLALVLAALCAAVALHVRFLLLAHRAYGETTRVLDSTEREFQSFFDSTLDAILILGDEPRSAGPVRNPAR